MICFENDWDKILDGEFDKDYYKKLRLFLKTEYSKYTVYPDMYDIFNAFKETSYSDVKVVILGQDPYHNPGQAHGMAFSVKEGIKPPPSLINIFKEQKSDLDIVQNKENGYLISWAKQGVLLLNTVLTVRAGLANSHRKQGWEIFTNTVISHLNNRQDPIIFILWGRPAQEKELLITNPNHYILKAAHPSPLSAERGFFGCRHFSKTNEILESLGKTPINWQL